MNNDSGGAFLSGVRACLLVSIAGIIFGFTFGTLAHFKGLTMMHTTLMSVIVYAGAAQILSLTLWHAQHLPIIALMATTFVVCLRFLLMSITLRPHFVGVQWWKVYFGLLFLVDESWAITLLRARRGGVSSTYIFTYFLGSALIFYLMWVIGTVLGYWSSHWLHDPRMLGVDFAFTALFLALLIGMWRGKHDILPWVVTAIVAIMAYHYVHGSWYIIIAALVGSAVGVWHECR